ncbi:hypothetical protein EIN_452760 [Entamoeba invadens IP1]|uniref:Uncharacterized protein n=1 Tax=Entamoeba invadens IP1 TaxID=370355 RepID=L7FMM9_ENTIV|nr:hypothetical protein EIN_452760 [Entamoeba invadens IP1]ELP89676.1 hypothetical protein EIN_452760 [Entamoeba invadens IP1]|eukprot:XP_004256447.1 hypothetical protein EIN_452760 [Entamoeba invadens IP1]
MSFNKTSFTIGGQAPPPNKKPAPPPPHKQLPPKLPHKEVNQQQQIDSLEFENLKTEIPENPVPPKIPQKAPPKLPQRIPELYDFTSDEKQEVENLNGNVEQKQPPQLPHRVKETTEPPKLPHKSLPPKLPQKQSEVVPFKPTSFKSSEQVQGVGSDIPQHQISTTHPVHQSETFESQSTCCEQIEPDGDVQDCDDDGQNAKPKTNKTEMAKNIAGDTVEVYKKLPPMTAEQKEFAKQQSIQASKTAYSGAKKAVKTEEFKQASHQTASAAKAVATSKQAKGLCSGLASGALCAIKGESAGECWKATKKEVPKIDADQKAGMKQRMGEAKVTAKSSYSKAKETEEWKAAKGQAKVVGKEVYHSEQFKVAEKEGKKKAAVRMTGDENAEFDMKVAVETEFRPEIVEEDGKRKIDLGLKVKPKLKNQDTVVCDDLGCVETKYHVGKKPGEDGCFDVDMKRNNKDVKEKSGPTFKFETDVKPEVKLDENGDVKVDINETGTKFKPKKF